MKAVNPRIVGQETFHWEHQIFNISALLTAIERGDVLVWESTIYHDEIERLWAFLVREKHPDVSAGLVQKHRVQVDLAYAATLTLADLSRPIMMLHVGNGAGMIELPTLERGANYVLADGNHRVVRAYQLQLQELPLVIIPRVFATNYLIEPDDAAW